MDPEQRIARGLTVNVSAVAPDHELVRCEPLHAVGSRRRTLLVAERARINYPGYPPPSIDWAALQMDAHAEVDGEQRRLYGVRRIEVTIGTAIDSFGQVWVLWLCVTAAAASRVV